MTTDLQKLIEDKLAAAKEEQKAGNLALTEQNALVYKIRTYEDLLNEVTAESEKKQQANIKKEAYPEEDTDIESKGTKSNSKKGSK